MLYSGRFFRLSLNILLLYALLFMHWAARSSFCVRCAEGCSTTKRCRNEGSAELRRRLGRIPAGPIDDPLCNRKGHEWAHRQDVALWLTYLAKPSASKETSPNRYGTLPGAAAAADRA